MKELLKIEKEFELKTLEVKAGVRYWEDAEVNGVIDTEGDLIPLRSGDLWCPVIDIDTGVIHGWPAGVKADIHYKICDSGSYYIKDESGETVLSIEDNYVPSCLSPKGGGYGDYIKMYVDGNGKIAGWKFDISDFETED